jgi:hypothetical protein
MTIDNAGIAKIDTTKSFFKLSNHPEFCILLNRIFIDTIINENELVSIIGYTSIEAIITGNVPIAVYEKIRKRFYLKEIMCVSDSNGYFKVTFPKNTSHYICPYDNSWVEVYKIGEIEKMGSGLYGTF